MAKLEIKNNTIYSLNELNELSDIMTDVIMGDNEAAEHPTFVEKLKGNSDRVQVALKYLLNNPELNEVQKSYLIQNSWKILYTSKPPTPEEFLTDKYLGRAILSTYPRVKDSFKLFFRSDSEYRDLILYPCIGWGKSYLSTLITLYIATHLALMRDSKEYFGLSPASIIAQGFISYSIEKTSELLLEPFLNILAQSPYFERVRTADKMRKLDFDWKNQKGIKGDNKIYWTTAAPSSALSFSNGANVKIVTNPSKLLGINFIQIVLSEISFFLDAGKSPDYVMRMYNDAKGRIESRLRGNYWGRTILDSSPNDIESPIDNYILTEAHKNPKNLIIKGAEYDWRPEDYQEPDKRFPIYKGGKGRPPQIVPDHEVGNYSPTDIEWAPVEKKQYYIDDLLKSLKDISGIPSGQKSRFITDHRLIDNIFMTEFRSIEGHIFASVKEDPAHCIWDSIKDIFFNYNIGKYSFYYKPHIPRVLSVDPALTGDNASLAVSHYELCPIKKENIVVVDMLIVISPLGGRISLDAIKYFIKDLIEIGGIHLEAVSFDNFQSESMIQYLTSIGIETKKLSVDRDITPYINLLSLITTGRLKAGRNLYFKNELKTLEYSKRPRTGTVKVDHSSGPTLSYEGGEKAWEVDKCGMNQKDASDSVCASVELLKQCFPYGATEVWNPDRINISDKQKDDDLNNTLKSLGLRF